MKAKKNTVFCTRKKLYQFSVIIVNFLFIMKASIYVSCIFPGQERYLQHFKSIVEML